MDQNCSIGPHVRRPRSPACLAGACTLILLAGCSARSEWGFASHEDGRRSYEAWENSVKPFPYSASPERKERIRSGYPKVELGMTKAQVESIIGEPDFSTVDYEPLTLIPHWTGSSWTYYVRKKADLYSLIDPEVYISFDTHERTDWISSNITGLPEKGDPPRYHPDPFPTTQFDGSP